MNYFSGYGENKHSSLYLKAQEIRNISRRISDYILPDLAVLNESGNEDKRIYFTGDIIRHSNSLLFNIARAENEFLPDSRMRYAASVSRLTEQLFRYCEALEKANTNGRDFLRVLRKELKKFQKQQTYWRLGL